MGRIMKRGKLWGVRVITIFLVVLFSASASMALEYDIGDKKLYVDGYLEQYARFGFHNTDTSLNGDYVTSGSHRGLMDAFSSFYTWQQLIFSDSLEFRTAFRLEGDFLSYDIDKYSNDYGDIKKSEGRMNIDDHSKQIVRECNFAYFSPHLNMRIGKQTVAWGQTDLLRLMDMINPIDYRRMYVLRDSDYGYQESRIPLWIAKFDYFPEISIGDISGIGLEFIWTYETESATRFEIGPRNGGVWAFPIPYDMPVIPGLGGFKDLTIHDRCKNETLGNSTVAFRTTSNWGNTFFTLNAYYGWADMPVLARSKSNPNMVYKVTDGGNVADGPGYGLELDKVYNRKIALGFTVSREMDFIRSFVQSIGQVANPTLRIESYYRFNKEFSTDWIEKIKRGAATPATAGKEFKKRDVIRYMVGFDWPLRISFLNPRKEFFSTFQFIHAHIVGGGNFWEAPYHCETPTDKYDITGLVNTTYMSGMIRPQMAFTSDLNHSATLLKGSCRFWFGDHWRPEIGFMMITGKRDTSHGMFSNRDNAWLKVKYQF